MIFLPSLKPFTTITGDDWKRELKAGRGTPNDISLQIKMKLKPENPTPGTPVSQPQIQPVTTKEIVDVLANLVTVIDDANLDRSFSCRVLLSRIKQTINDLESRL